MAKSLGRVILELREEVGLTRRALARAAKLDPATLSRIETEDRVGLRFVTVCQLAAALGVSLDEIAARAGLTKMKGLVKSRPVAKGAELLKGLDAIDSLLAQVGDQTSRLKKRLSTD